MSQHVLSSHAVLDRHDRGIPLIPFAVQPGSLGHAFTVAAQRGHLCSLNLTPFVSSQGKPRAGAAHCRGAAWALLWSNPGPMCCQARQPAGRRAHRRGAAWARR